MQFALCVVYFAVLACLAMYGLHRSHLVLTCLRLRGRLRELACGVAPLQLEAGSTQAATLPVVTIQLPLFNEATVAERLLDHVARIRYDSRSKCSTIRPTKRE
jgi:hypothetical protein